MYNSYRIQLIAILKKRGWAFVYADIDSKNHNEVRYAFKDRTIKLSCCMNKPHAKAMLKQAKRLEVSARRDAMKVVSGGMAWVPQGLSIGTPKGKLTLVKKAA